MLAFAFLATFGFNGLVDDPAQGHARRSTSPSDSTWLYGMTGLTVVYTYFQIPLMVIVFLPALDGLRQEWWEASTSLGGSSWSYWRHVGGPILAPSFLGAVLLLFANAFSAYATAAALVSQGSPIVPLQIGEAMSRRGRPGAGEHRQGAGPRHDRRRRGRHDAVRAPPATGVAVAAMTRGGTTVALGRAMGDPRPGRRLPAAAAGRDGRVLDARRLRRPFARCVDRDHRRTRTSSRPSSRPSPSRP